MLTWWRRRRARRRQERLSWLWHDHFWALMRGDDEAAARFRAELDLDGRGGERL